MEKVPIPPGFVNARLISDEGTVKDVFKAFHVSSKSWKILKRFREPPSTEMLQEEMRPLARLRHPNIVVQDPPLHIGEDIWVIEEILDTTFEDLAPLDHKYGIAVYAGQIAEAIAYLHEPSNHSGKAMVHGDIHLKNCGLVRGVAKLFDFGKATYANEEAPQGRGYICTRAPEQFRETARVATGIDIWAFGCTLYGLRTAEYPFMTPGELASFKEADEVEKQRIAESVGSRAEVGLADDIALRLRSKFDDGLWNLISKMVVRDPSARPPADEVVSEINEYREAVQVFSIQGDEDIPRRLAKQASEALDRGDVRKLDWFDKLVRAQPGDG